MSQTEIQLTDGTTWCEDCQRIERIEVKVSGWVNVRYTENNHTYNAGIPPHRVEQIIGDVNYQRPHGRI